MLVGPGAPVGRPALPQMTWTPHGELQTSEYRITGMNGTKYIKNSYTHNNIMQDMYMTLMHSGVYMAYVCSVSATI